MAKAKRAELSTGQSHDYKLDLPANDSFSKERLVSQRAKLLKCH
jgi:hypothetical protein